MTEINHKLRVAIVEDEPLIAENLAMYLNNTDFEVAGIAYNYEDALQLIISEHPDIALLDINLECEKDGIDLGEYIFNHLHIPFIFLSSYSDRSTLDRAKKIQPSGYLVKPFNEKSLLTTLEIGLANYAMQANQVVPTLQLKQLNKHLISPISDREFEVISLIYAGKTNQQIAQELYISLNTIKRHINNVYTRLDVTSRSMAIAKMRELMLK
ncbi:MAG: response regulator transcription factor [Saprospiraceae bacterium]|jgi:DNA-binding NarL/FixJ family response regulator|nr:response regulator transcription factor [Candidatus Defluviibacterium haderslevense]MBK7246025.1 response regulator transcription factor [Candidatus Defluviibacterium haderslevense]MCI1267301.1 response regulator transcription factor [Saprospiraceae bacterium]